MHGFSGAGMPLDEREEQERILERTSIARQVYLLCTDADPELRPAALAEAIGAFTCFSKKVDLTALSQSDLVKLRTAQEHALASLRAGQTALEQQLRNASVGLTHTNAVLSQKVEATERMRYTAGVPFFDDPGKLEGIAYAPGPGELTVVAKTYPLPRPASPNPSPPYINVTPAELKATTEAINAVLGSMSAKEKK